jgi:hypothetical protein
MARSVGSVQPLQPSNHLAIELENRNGKEVRLSVDLPSYSQNVNRFFISLGGENHV